MHQSLEQHVIAFKGAALLICLAGTQATANTKIDILNCANSSRPVEVATFDHFIGSATATIKAQIDPGESTVANCATSECTLVFITDASVVKKTTSSTSVSTYVDAESFTHVEDSNSACK